MARQQPPRHQRLVHDIWGMAAMVCQKCLAVFMGIANMQSCLCHWFGTTACCRNMHFLPDALLHASLEGDRLPTFSHIEKHLLSKMLWIFSFFNLSLKHPWKRLISKESEKFCKGPFLKFLKAFKYWNTTNLLLKTSEAKWWPGWIPPPSCCFANRGLSERRHAKTVTRCKLRR